MTEDILERAKDAAENIDHYAYDCDFEEARLVILALIPEVERLRSENEALNEKLVEERARRICHLPREDEVGHWPRYEDIVVKEARQQLADEMPGVT